MIRFRNNLFPTMLLGCVLIGLPPALCAQAPDAAFEPSALAAGDVQPASNERDLLKAVLQTREEVRALRREVDSLRKILGSKRGKNTPVTVQADPRHLEPGVIGLVTSEDKSYDLRSYPVADLVVPLPGEEKTDVGDNFAKLIGLVTDTVQPKSWRKGGGEGRVGQDQRTFSLVIQQTPAVHRQVLAFLRSLRSLQEWQVCLELTLIENPPADLLQGIGTSNPLEGTKWPLPLNDEQRTKLLAAAGGNPNSKLLSVSATMFYGTRGSIGFAQHENQTIDVELADSTDRHAANLRFSLHNSGTGKVTAEPVAVSIPNLKTIVVEFRPLGAGASARPSLLVVRPRLLFPFDEEEVRQ
jgi:hypothetical protein